MERIAPWLQTQWDRRAAGNFIGGGTGAGLAICAAASTLAAGPPQAAVYALAGLSIAAGLALVWLEIGRPWRFLHVFFHPQTSWMTREALAAPPLLLALAVAAWQGGAAPALAALLLAVVFLYCQARILSAARGIPAWREKRIVPLIIATGLAEGAGLFLALAAASGAAIATLIFAWALAALASRWLAWTAYRRRLDEQGAPREARRALKAIDRPLLLAGTLAPAALILAALLFAGVAAPLAAAAGLLALGTGWALKLTIVLRAAFNQGFALPHLPRLDAARGDSSARPGWS
jgi:phenylacetyl-CoA:acceptor oxidoreductase 26-kDa subunit